MARGERLNILPRPQERAVQVLQVHGEVLTNMKKALIATLVAAALAIVVGCGNKEEDTTAPATPPANNATTPPATTATTPPATTAGDGKGGAMGATAGKGGAAATTTG